MSIESGARGRSVLGVESGVELRLERVRRLECDGVTLAVSSDGAVAQDSTRPVIVLHGFTGSGESMAGVAGALGIDRPVHRIDLIGHGRSDAPEDVAHYSMERCSQQIMGVIDALALEDPHLLGYSMGARVALSLCVSHPERFASALLVGVSPGFDDLEARADRVRSDTALAGEITSGDLPGFVDRWMALPLFASQKRLGEDALAAARSQRLQCNPVGLANSLLGMGTGAMPPLHAALPRVELPVRIVVGEEDAKFRGIAEDLVSALPDAALEVIAQAGHAAHLEQPEPFLRAARNFYASVDAKRAAHEESR